MLLADSREIRNIWFTLKDDLNSKMESSLRTNKIFLSELIYKLYLKRERERERERSQPLEAPLALLAEEVWILLVVVLINLDEDGGPQSWRHGHSCKFSPHDLPQSFSN